MTAICATLLLLCVFFISGEVEVLATCGGSLNLSSLVHELILDTESYCSFEVYPPGEANTTLLFVEQVRGLSETSNSDRVFRSRACYLRYIQESFSSCITLVANSPPIEISINGSFQLEVYRSWYPLNLTFAVDSYQGVANCGADFVIDADSSVKLTVTRTSGCQDYCILNVTAQRQLAIICPSPFCHYILYSYAAGQLMRPALDNIYPLNGTKANLLLYVPSNNRMRIVVEARVAPPISPVTTLAPKTTSNFPITTPSGSTASLSTSAFATTTSSPISPTSPTPPPSISSSNMPQTTVAPSTTSTRLPTSTNSPISATTEDSGGNNERDCPQGFFRRIGCFFQKLWEKFKALIDSCNLRGFRRI